MDKPDLMSDALIPEIKQAKSSKIQDETERDGPEQPELKNEETKLQNRNQVDVDGYK